MKRRDKYAAEVRLEAKDLPTILYVLYRMVSVQQTNLFAWDGRIVSKRCHFSLRGCIYTYNEHRRDT